MTRTAATGWCSIPNGATDRPALLVLFALFSGCATGGRDPAVPAVETLGALPQSSEQRAAALESPLIGVLRYIPAGEFTMGASPAGEMEPALNGKPHRVTITQGFWLMEHEVTESQWTALMGELPYANRSGGPEHPVGGMSWEEANEFARRAGAQEGAVYRLPTEAEWEYAARGGKDTLYSGSDDVDAVAWYDGNSGLSKKPVCQKHRNAWGLCDMSGNLMEWTADWYGRPSAEPVQDPVGPDAGSHRVARGGAYLFSASQCELSFRPVTHTPTGGLMTIGFRLASSP